MYGPDNLPEDRIRLVGSYRTEGTSEFNFGFVWEGTLADLPSGGTFQQIAYPRATYQFTHSTMGGLAVGNADSPTRRGLPLGPGRAYIYDVENGRFLTNIVFPGSKSNTAYGIWHNGENKYTICGGFSPLATNNLLDQGRPLNQGRAFLVDYDASTGKFSNWTSFDYPNSPDGVQFITHFEGISSTEPGVYYLNADSVQSGTDNPAQGSWVTVRRNSNGKFDRGIWVDLNYGNDGISSSNSVYGNQVVGLFIDESGTSAFQATINLGFQLSNVLSANRGNGITLRGARRNIIAMNNIGTSPAGDTTPGFGNGMNGIYLTQGASENLIGGQVAGPNDPTGDKGEVPPVFFRPPQGNLISGNGMHGVLMDSRANNNTLSGNFIGTDATGLEELGNGANGVTINAALPNGWDGVHISGTAYRNVLGGFKPSIETRNHFSGNGGYGVAISGQAYNNVVYNSNIGYGFALTDGLEPSIPNQWGGILLDQGTAASTIGGRRTLQANKISTNQGGGLTIYASLRNAILGNQINENADFGIYASGVCNGTRILRNTIQENGSSPADNVDLVESLGILFVP